MREEAAKHPAPPRAPDANPWHEPHPTLRALQQDAPPDSARAEAYSDWADRLRKKQEERRAVFNPQAEPDDRPNYWHADAVFAESKRAEQEVPADRANPWRVRELLALLDLREGATAAEIGSAYRRLAKQHHPDRFLDADPDTQEFHADRMRAIIEAYRELRTADI
jgi:hypothetical protein